MVVLDGSVAHPVSNVFVDCLRTTQQGNDKKRRQRKAGTLRTINLSQLVQGGSSDTAPPPLPCQAVMENGGEV